MIRLFISLGLALLTGAASMAEVERPVRLPKVEFPTEAAIKATIDKGSSFLKKRQNANGSWGSARQTKGLGQAIISRIARCRAKLRAHA